MWELSNPAEVKVDKNFWKMENTFEKLSIYNQMDFTKCFLA